MVGGDLEVRTRLAELGSRSARMHQEIRRFRDDKVVVDTDLTFAPLDVKASRPLAIEGELRGLLAPLVLED
ncbi:hypothetical protein DU490_14220 [Halomonas sp. DQ26W]|uniref:acyl-CoA thioesterase n=1 Tax=Halomonas sp. DQ26W TaxID=2282311 RepID=UPI000DF7F02B|nr:hypothetical protein [Halomonas sp. DQ26W]RDB42253.1 hypothetical protein DU490_14220 [Halomonas sp. DQ26W]